ncbi:hypothetical protein GBA52_008538 [Prunus armeniaca]|nr:hypothetical protein GBA52_008538 [Prunus armeniaca]
MRFKTLAAIKSSIATPENTDPTSMEYGNNNLLASSCQDEFIERRPNINKGLVLNGLDVAKTQWYHFKAIVIARIGLFTYAYDLFFFSFVTKNSLVVYTTPSKAQNSQNFGGLHKKKDNTLGAITRAKELKSHQASKIQRRRYINEMVTHDIDRIKVAKNVDIA